jgi:hypothetical protein
MPDSNCKSLVSHPNGTTHPRRPQVRRNAPKNRNAAAVGCSDWFAGASPSQGLRVGRPRSQRRCFPPQPCKLFPSRIQFFDTSRVLRRPFQPRNRVFKSRRIPLTEPFRRLGNWVWIRVNRRPKLTPRLDLPLGWYTNPVPNIPHGRFAGRARNRAQGVGRPPHRFPTVKAYPRRVSQATPRTKTPARPKPANWFFARAARPKPVA